MRSLRKLVLGETWELPLGITLAVALSGVVRLIAGPDGWWRDAGGAFLAVAVAVALAASLRRGS
jgi:hypothetical protein